MLGLGRGGQETSGTSAPGLPSPHSRDQSPGLGVLRALCPEHQPQAARWWVRESVTPLAWSRDLSPSPRQRGPEWKRQHDRHPCPDLRIDLSVSGGGRCAVGCGSVPPNGDEPHPGDPSCSPNPSLPNHTPHPSFSHQPCLPSPPTPPGFGLLFPSPSCLSLPACLPLPPPPWRLFLWVTPHPPPLSSF